MPDQEITPSKKAFVRDVRSLREGAGVTLASISEKTKILQPTLKEFEATGLFLNPLFDRVHLRSLTATYAKVIGLDVAQMHAALEQALRDTYDGALSREDKSESSPEETTASPEAEPETTPKAEVPDLASPAPTPAVEASAASDSHPPKGAMHSSRRHRSTRRRRGMNPGAMVTGAAIVIIVTIVYVMLFFTGRSDQLPLQETSAAPVMAGGTTAVEPESYAPALTIAEGFHVILFGVSDIVPAMDIVIDGIDGRTCWIERGRGEGIFCP